MINWILSDRNVFFFVLGLGLICLFWGLRRTWAFRKYKRDGLAVHSYPLYRAGARSQAVGLAFLFLSLLHIYFTRHQ